MNIYCKHKWSHGVCGIMADSHRECDRCGERWDRIGDKRVGGFFDYPEYIGIYGKEPKTVIGTTKGHK